MSGEREIGQAFFPRLGARASQHNLNQLGVIEMLNPKRVFVLFPVLLGLLIVGIASANGGGKDKVKNYELTIGAATKVGSVVLKPGEYKFKVEGTNVVFTKQGNDTAFTVTAKTESAKAEFTKTITHQVQDAGQPRIIAIELKGTQSLVKFD